MLRFVYKFCWTQGSIVIALFNILSKSYRNYFAPQGLRRSHINYTIHIYIHAALEHVPPGIDRSILSHKTQNTHTESKVGCKGTFHDKTTGENSSRRLCGGARLPPRKYIWKVDVERRHEIAVAGLRSSSKRAWTLSCANRERRMLRMKKKANIAENKTLRTLGFCMIVCVKI